MPYAPDPGAHFDSDPHRRVLGHLSLPSDKFGWGFDALVARLKGTGTRFADVEAELKTVLEELKAAGFATDNDKGVWQQTQEGADKLVAEVPDSALADATVPATITAATPIGEPVAEAPGQAPTAPAAIVPDGVPAPPEATSV